MPRPFEYTSAWALKMFANSQDGRRRQYIEINSLAFTKRGCLQKARASFARTMRQKASNAAWTPQDERDFRYWLFAGVSMGARIVEVRITVFGERVTT